MILRSVLCLTICLVTSGCSMFGYRQYPPPKEVVEPEELGPFNNVITKREWALCSRICMKGKNLKGLIYDPDRDVLQCRCVDGLAAEIYRPDDD